jgi:hypothetical protein
VPMLPQRLLKTSVLCALERRDSDTREARKYNKVLCICCLFLLILCNTIELTIFVLVLVHIIIILVSTVSFHLSCAREVISPTTTELEESPFTEKSLRTKTLICHTLERESSPWRMLDQEPMDPSFSSAPLIPHGWYVCIVIYYYCIVDS